VSPDVEPARDVGLDWRVQALCAQIPAERDLWFSVRGSDRRAAAEICALCPVQLECLAFAMSWRSYAECEAERPQGVWGGWFFPTDSHKGAGRLVPRPVLPPPPRRHLVGV